MKIQLSILSALIAGCAAAAKNIVDLSVNIPANSKLGNDILSKARRVNDAEEEQFTWQNQYDIRFHSCHILHLFGGDMEGQEEEGANPVGSQQLVKFKLCPSNAGCSKCQYGGEYVVEMREFLEVYLEAKEEIEQAQCEAVEGNCNCDYYEGDDDEACLSKCYADANLDFCVEDDFEIAAYLECAAAEFSNEEYYSKTFFIGPTCDDTGKYINLGLFKDQTCSIATDTSSYADNMYGATLPYSDKSMVDHEYCISCKEAAEDEYYQEEGEPIELCQQLYMESAKCEQKMKGKENVDVGSCTYINDVIPALERVYRNNGSGFGGRNSSTILAWIFFFTTLAASAGLFYFFNMNKRKNVDLSSNGNGGIL